MAASPQRQRNIDWYTVSADTLRGWVGCLVLLVVTGLAFVTYKVVERQLLAGRVERLLAESRGLYQTLRLESRIDEYRSEYDAARGSLEEAREHQQAGELREALRQAERSRGLLTSILDAIRRQGASGEARFIAVEGGVEFRRGERGAWQQARSRVSLQPGDYVKTSGGGSAEIMTVDGTLYTVRSDTVILIGRERQGLGRGAERGIDLEFGWVDLSTSRSASRVKTPGAEARVRRESSAVIAYDGRARVSRFAAYRGELEVTSNGERRAVRALEQVEQSGAALSQPKPLPRAPVPIEPPDNLELQLEGSPRLVLSWEPVDGARRYALQVARNRLFVDNVIDVEDRAKTSATLGVQGDGIFLWRVAAFGREGVRGPWSQVRRFRVVSPRERAPAAEAAAAPAPAP